MGINSLKLFIIALAGSCMICGCGNSKELAAEKESLAAQVESLQKENADLSAELSSLKADKEEAEQKLSAIEESLAAAEKEKEIQEGDVTVALISKSSIPKDSSKWIFSNYCVMGFEVTNHTDKDIQGVQGILKSNDLFGEEILSAGCDFVGDTIPAHQSISVELQFEVNEFMNDHMKLYNTEFKDLKCEYTVTKIVFTDGTVKE